MIMYWLLVFFAGLLLGGLSPDQRAVQEAGQLQDQTQQCREKRQSPGRAAIQR